MDEGVTIIDPASTYIDAEVQIGLDTVIYPSVQIYGASVIGEDVTIHSFSRITNSRIGARTTVLEGCIINNSGVGEEVSLGPFSHLRFDVTCLATRPRSAISSRLKKTNLGFGSKSHASGLSR